MIFERLPVQWQVLSEIGSVKVRTDNEGDKPRYLYHILKWEFAKIILESGLIRLRQVDEWQDPYESWWSRQINSYGGKLAGVTAYGSCWTTRAHDEPRWRMAQAWHCDPVVRLRCSPGSLLDLSWDATGAGGRVFLGKVRYRYVNELTKLASTHSVKPVTQSAATLWIHKRMAFRFESEVRLLWIDNEAKADFRYVPIKADTIDQIMISPYASASQTADIRDYLKKIGMNVSQSLLLRAP